MHIFIVEAPRVSHLHARQLHPHHPILHLSSQVQFKLISQSVSIKKLSFTQLVYLYSKKTIFFCKVSFVSLASAMKLKFNCLHFSRNLM